MEFGPTITKFRDFVEYFLSVAVIIFKNSHKEKLKRSLNLNSELIEEIQKKFGRNFQEKYEKHKRNFSLGTYLKLLKSIVFFISYLIVVKVQKINPIHFVVLAVPNLAVLVISNELCLGVITFKFHLEIINDLLKKAHRKLRKSFNSKFQQLKNELEICDFLDEISLTHSKVYEIYQIFLSMFQLQFLVMIFTTFFSIVLDFFYITSIKVYSSFNVLSERSYLLVAICLMLIPLRCLEMYWHLKTCNDLSLLGDKNLRIVLDLETFGTDSRLKSSVSYFILVKYSNF